MSNPYRDRLLTVGLISRRSRDTVHEGRTHPETGRPYKAIRDELGNTVTEHATRDDRVDVHIKAPTVTASMVQGEKRD